MTWTPCAPHSIVKIGNKLLPTLIRAEHTANKTLPSWFLPYLSNTELARASRPVINLVLPTGSKHTPHVHVQDLPPFNWDVHLIEFKYYGVGKTFKADQNAKERQRLWLGRQECTVQWLDYIRWVQEIANSYVDQQQSSKERRDVIEREERGL